MKKLILLLFVVACFASCNNDNSTSTTNPFAGNWNMVFAGTFTGGGQFTIASNGSFSANVILTTPDGTFTNTVSGTVSTSGVLTNGRILEGGSQVGTIAGNFSGNSGSGTWQTNVSSGTWSASR